jgi:hypothetical protein|tara:strand:+ start:214 stop:456 length:243 start_codon:yes stop_codon:yes gene_type:complete
MFIVFPLVFCCTHRLAQGIDATSIGLGGRCGDGKKHRINGMKPTGIGKSSQGMAIIMKNRAFSMGNAETHALALTLSVYY